ncbi:TetR/AcrR family transcriptional regulator [Nocardioides gilvus]|uniref:TetR/AcrR family transcriptional regulator n=1 Tax=Nocardioides gilvus TaxID=1735589 RepID=UPI000D742A39|nr:TetR/AcrR family transcriptional regulator [Nocardioides gilvus]
MAETRGRRRDASRNHDLIVDVARRSLRSGVSLSLETIAAEAGVGIATLYRHFPNRESLEREVRRVIFTEEVEPLLELIDEERPRWSFLEISERLIDLVVAHSIGSGAPINLFESIRDAHDEFTAPFEELVRRGVEEGELRADLEVDDLLWLLHMFVTGFSVPEATPAIRRRHLSLVFDAITPGAHEPLPPTDR